MARSLHPSYWQQNGRLKRLPSLALLFSGYSHHHEPLGTYAALTGAYNALFATFLLASKAFHRPLPDRIGLGDLLLLGAATHKLSRTIARDWVTSFLRAPFTRYEEEGELPKEVSETARGQGLRYAIGQLITCPLCTGQWVAALLTYALVWKLAVGRLIASVFTIISISDFLRAAWVLAGTKMEQAGTEPDQGQQSQEQA